jgi:hypothetical protein
MKAMVTIALLLFPLLSFAENAQVACMQQFDEQLKNAGTETMNVARSLNYSMLLERASRCVQAGKCVKADLFVSVMEIMVDETIVNLQREKVAVLKDYFSKNKDKLRSNNYCAVVATFPVVTEKLQTLNQAQVDRYRELVQKKLDDIPIS